jgi:hypothetical protein
MEAVPNSETEPEKTNADMREQMAQLRALNASALRTKYRELFGEESRSRSRQVLFRRVAWRVQALAEGDLSERARRRALEIANDADLKIQGSRNDVPGELNPAIRDRRLPPIGTLLRRQHGNSVIEVKVLPQAFECQGRQYRSLSALASELTGTRWNGFVFFGLAGRRGGRCG